MSSVYIHIPFCKSICAYCDFCKVLKRAHWVSKYYEALKAEIEERYNGEEVSTIYFGGGTPSSLGPKALRHYLSLTNLFNKNKLVEFTFECNIDDIDEELLSILKEYGVNRLSIGIESFNPIILELLNRHSNYEDAKQKMKLIREYGFNNVNLDLIYAVPGEDEDSLKDDLKKIISLEPEHISTYSLMIEEHTMLYNERVKSIPEEEDLKMYNLICKMLKKKKYKHYEVSNFAREGYESLHNKTYWHNEEYYGFGLSASGYFDGVRYTNTKNLTKYLSGNYQGEEELLTKKDIMDNHLMLGLRLLDGVNMEEFERLYNVRIDKMYPIKALLKNNELVASKGYLKIPHDKIYVMNEILLKLL